MQALYAPNTVIPDAAGVAPTAAEIKTAVEAVGSHLALILADTGELQTDWANGGRLDLLLDACALETTVAALNDITVADIIAGIADGTYDLQEMIRLIFSACCLKISGGGTTTISTRDSADAKNRVIATVDGAGNRTAVTLDGS